MPRVEGVLEESTLFVAVGVALAVSDGVLATEVACGDALTDSGVELVAGVAGNVLVGKGGVDVGAVVCGIDA